MGTEIFPDLGDTKGTKEENRKPCNKRHEVGGKGVNRRESKEKGRVDFHDSIRLCT